MKNIETGGDVQVGPLESISCDAKLLDADRLDVNRLATVKLLFAARAVSPAPDHGGKVLASGQLQQMWYENSRWSGSGFKTCNRR